MQEQVVNRRRFLRMAAMGVAGAALAACAPEATQAVKETVVVGGTPQVVEKVVTTTPAPKGKVQVHATVNHTLAVYDPLAYDLAKERIPHIDLVIDQTPSAGGWDVYADNLVTRIAGGEGLDIIFMGQEGVALITEKKAIRPLGPFLDADDGARQELEEDIHQRLWECLSWNGERVIIPYGCNPMLMWYNPRMFAEAGVPEPSEDWTWEDFVETCLRLVGEDRYAYSWWDAAFGMAPWYFNNDTSWLKNNWSDSNMDDPKVAETLQFLADLIHKHKVSPELAGWDESGNFHSGHLAMRGCGRWCLGATKTAGFEDYKFTYYPHKSGDLKTVIGAEGWGIATMTNNPEECWEAITKVLASFEMALSFTNVIGPVPARRSVSETADFLAGPPGVDMRMFYASFDYGAVVPSPPNFNVVDPLLTRWYAQLWAGDINVDQLVKGAHEELQEAMDKLKA